MFALMMAASLGLAVYAVSSPMLGWFIGVTSAVGVSFFWWRSKSPVQVTDHELLVGRCQLPLAAVGQVRSLDAAEFQLRITSQAKSTDFYSLVARKNGGVEIQISDPSDPFKAWVVASKDPEKLATTLISSKSA